MGSGPRTPLPVRAVGRPAPLRARHADRQEWAGASLRGVPRPLASRQSLSPGLRILRGARLALLDPNVLRPARQHWPCSVPVRAAWRIASLLAMALAHRRYEFLHRSEGVESDRPERIGLDRGTRRPVGVLGVDGLPRNGSVERSRKTDAEVFRDSAKVVVGRKTVCAGDSHAGTRQ